MKLQIDELGFVGLNVEDWDINRSYRKPTITTDYNTWITYITRKNVPAGIPLTDNEYWKPILKESGSLENIIRRLDELERKVAYYHPEGDTVESITWTGYSVSPSTVQVETSATFVKGTVIAIYKSGRQEDVTNSAVFNAHRGSIVANTYLAPNTAGEDTIRASYNDKVADSILPVTVINGQLLTVQVGHGANYATALFTDTFETLSNNMQVSIDRNAGDYIFIKVDKNDTVNNLYIYNEGGGIFEYVEIALNAPVIDGNYKYYQSTNRYNTGIAIPYVINKV